MSLPLHRYEGTRTLFRPRPHRKRKIRGQARRSSFESLEPRTLLTGSLPPQIGGFYLDHLEPGLPMMCVEMGDTLTLNARDVADPDGGIKSFSFWIETDAVAGLIAGTGGDLRLYEAQPGGTEYVAGTSTSFAHEIVLPTIKSLYAPQPITVSAGTLTFYARVEDFENNVTVVERSIWLLDMDVKASNDVAGATTQDSDFVVMLVNDDDDVLGNGVPDFGTFDVTKDDDLVMLTVPRIPAGFEDGTLTLEIEGIWHVNGFVPGQADPLGWTFPLAQINLADLDLSTTDPLERWLNGVVEGDLQLVLEGLSPTTADDPVVFKFTFEKGGCEVTDEITIRVLSRAFSAVITGTALYESSIAKDPGNPMRAVRGALVFARVTDAAGLTFESEPSFTDDNGDYTLRFTPPLTLQAPLTAKVVLSPEHKPWESTGVVPFRVVDNDGAQIEWPTAEFSFTLDTIARENIVIGLGETDAKAFEIYNALTTGYRYYDALPDRVEESIDIYFKTDVGTATAFYHSTALGKWIDIGPDAHTDWDGIIEEYAHFIQWANGFFGFFDNSTDPHGPGYNLRYRDWAWPSTDALTGDDQEDAWIEGWAAYFSQIAQRRQNARTLELNKVDDGKHIVYDLEKPGGSTLNFTAVGEDNEASVARILWRLANLPYDADVWSDDIELWENTRVLALADFWFLATVDTDVSTKLKYGAVFEYAGVSAQNLTVDYATATGIPALQFEIPRGRDTDDSNTLREPLFDRFQIMIHDSQLQYLDSSEVLEIDANAQPLAITAGSGFTIMGQSENSRNYVVSYQLTAVEWTELLSVGGELVWYVTAEVASFIAAPRPYWSGRSTLIAGAFDIALTGFRGDGYNLEVDYQVAGYDAKPFAIDIYAATDSELIRLMTYRVAEPSKLTRAEEAAHTVTIGVTHGGFDEIPQDYKLLAWVVSGDLNPIPANAAQWANDLAWFEAGAFVERNEETGRPQVVHYHGTEAANNIRLEEVYLASDANRPDAAWVLQLIVGEGEDAHVMNYPLERDLNNPDRPLPNTLPVHLRLHGGDDKLTAHWEELVNGVETTLHVQQEIWVFGGDGKDTLEGGTQDDILDGGAGDDTYIYRGNLPLGHDELREAPSADKDTLDFSLLGDDPQSVLIVDLKTSFSAYSSPSVMLVAGTFNEPTGFENVKGTRFDDVIWGNNRDNKLEGLGGDDLIKGGLGNDELFGGDGHDVLWSNTDENDIDQPFGGSGPNLDYHDMEGSGEAECDMEDGNYECFVRFVDPGIGTFEYNFGLGYTMLVVSAELVLVDGPLDAPLTVTIGSMDIIAQAGADYEVITTEVTFPAGSASGAQQPIQVKIFDDMLFECVEPFYLTMSELVYEGQHLIAIKNDEQQEYGSDYELVEIYDDDHQPGVHFEFAGNFSTVQEGVSYHSVGVRLVIDPEAEGCNTFSETWPSS